MAKTRSQISGGKLIVPTQRSFRRMDEAAEAHANDRQTTLSPNIKGRPRDGWPGNIVRVVYDQINVLPGEVYKLSAPLVTRQAQTRYNVVMNAVDPVAGEPFVIAMTPANDPGHPYGLAMDRGVCLARVDVIATGHEWASPVTGQPGHLDSGGAGAAKILWKSTAGTGVQDCLIQFPSAGPGAVSLHRFSANEDMGETTSNEMGVDLLELDGTDTLTDVTLMDPEDGFRELRGGDAGMMIQAGDGNYYPLHAERWRRINSYNAVASTTISGSGTKFGSPNFQDHPLSNIREPRSTDAGETIFRRSPNPTNEVTFAGSYYLTAQCMVEAVTTGVAHDVQIYVTVNGTQQTRSIRRFACDQQTGEGVVHPLQTEIDLINLSALDTVDVYVQDLGSSNPTLEQWVVRVEDVRD